MIKTSIVIGAYNEEAYIEGTLRALCDHLVSANILNTTEVIVVAANGTDRTKTIARSEGKKFKHFSLLEPGERVGKGRDVRVGVMHSSGSKVLFMDADLSTPLHYIDIFLDELDQGKDVVVGVRDLGTIHRQQLRRITSQVSNMLVRIVAVRGIHDTQCGFKAFSRITALALFENLRVLGWGFDIELLAHAQVKGMKVGTVAIPDWKDPKPSGDGLSGDRQLLAIMATLKDLMSISWRRATGRFRNEA